jgi:hypothetical protein
MPNRVVRRLGSCVLAGSALAVSAMFAQVSDAATLVDASCPQRGAIAFSPGLGIVPKPTAATVSGTLASCVSGAVTGGTVAGAGSGSLGCATGSVAGTLVFSWLSRAGEHAQSTVAVRSTQTAGSTGLTLTGTVTSGLFVGDDYTLAFVVNPLQLLQCLSAQGMTGVSVSAVGVFSRPLLAP